ncbi:nicotinate phosphoribosyltransferase [Pedobacter sp. BS3]|uniref:nicotinate phosphoribosyltransferase n=1 Tax=Pedobacter sp. BS3 TaxID=2567937 RepID=UPI0011EE16CA|nr:nicotinate phosphoribosyltransferase [Pedobacter sp. BS3]TZF84083.1 nicotinate phosphoribosyltransferase [Pedobacter sp. BS3]
MIPRPVSLLDNDFYKFTMQQGVIKLFPHAKAHYRFINRGNHQFPTGFARELEKALANFSDVALTLSEKEYLRATCPYLEATYLDFLQGYRYDPSEVTIKQQGTNLSVEITGYWYRTILWEVPLMALISELYYLITDQDRLSDDEIIIKNERKIKSYRNLGITVAEFGTRRRYSFNVHKLVVQALKQFGGRTFIGSSNVYLAMLNGIKPIGTHAHEWFMFHAARYGFKMANIMGLEHWVDVYRGDLGIALSDTYTTDVFFRQFDKMFSKLFDGIRHDSGDPVLFAQKAITHYKRMGIDPLSKTIIFSDGLDYDKVAHIAGFCRGKIGMSFGIGTNLTNDVGPHPLNIVIKMVRAQPANSEWMPVVKLSDEHGKYTGDEQTITLAKTVLGIS